MFYSVLILAPSPPFSEAGEVWCSGDPAADTSILRPLPSLLTPAPPPSPLPPPPAGPQRSYTTVNSCIAQHVLNCV